MSQTDLPLKGVRVLEVARVLAGPLCGQLLGDLGAEVVKIERPGEGDETRHWGPPFMGPFSAYFLSCNRNKRSLALDLSQPEGRELLYALACCSDVLLENFRPASARRLGLCPEELLRRNPRLVICSLSGFGRTGPWRDRPGYDFAIQALSGLMSITGPPEGPPCKVGVAITDVVTALYAAVAILARLQERERTGRGGWIDLALLDCAVAAQVNLVQAYLCTGQVPPRQGNAHLQIVPYQAFATADGWLVLAVGNDPQWQRFCQVAERPDLAADPRFTSNPLRVQHRHILIPLLEELLRTRSLADWQQRLTAADVPHAPVWNYADLFASAQAQARGLRIEVPGPDGASLPLVASPLRLEGMPLPPPTPPPRLGQDSDAVLRSWLHLSDSRLAELRARGILG
jgi:crotonobetainyl-CoA:carnitine CoA-transferase CaiB-like acyl-CoA transferase